ncbi:hypothetical protein ACDI10_09925 [Vreelandella venusta]|uniref:hypothetical protein n=1 Tax=Vreelandella venusta TaxID=44935 RepID=UPI003557D4B9
MSKERPILFNAAMVRAILNGHKTQTRRAIKLKTGDTFDEHALSAAIQEWRPMYDEVAQKVVGKTAALIRCPYGQPGDRLWVRETFQGPLVDQEEMEKDPTYFKDMGRYKNPEHCAYRASGDSCEYVDQDGDLIQLWKPSIHMPRWASRIMLEIVSVRVERLQDISNEDAVAEGIGTPLDIRYAALDEFKPLWKSINGAGSWAANPWVWVIEFKRLEASQ